MGRLGPWDGSNTHVYYPLFTPQNGAIERCAIGTAGGATAGGYGKGYVRVRPCQSEAA